MHSSHLISAQALARHLDDPQWRLIDCRFDLGAPAAGRKGYLEGHIPGALYADLNEDLAAKPTAVTGRHPLPAVADMAALFGAMGIAAETQVVVYDSSNGSMAARCWWLLRWLGHSRVALLDGGMSHWQALRLPLKSGQERVEPTEFVAHPRHEMVISSDELASRVANSDTLRLLDVRDSTRFQGEAEPIDAVAGHIPGARNLPFTSSLDEEGRWKGVPELRSMLAEHLGTDLSAPWSVMCGSGVTACHLAIAGMQAGYREPRLYVGSWSEWIRDPDRPVSLGPP